MRLLSLSKGMYLLQTVGGDWLPVHSEICDGVTIGGRAESRPVLKQFTLSKIIIMKGFVYILECSDGSYYTGSTKYLERRLAQHQALKDKILFIFKADSNANIMGSIQIFIINAH